MKTHKNYGFFAQIEYNIARHKKSDIYTKIENIKKTINPGKSFA